MVRLLKLLDRETENLVQPPQIGILHFIIIEVLTLKVCLLQLGQDLFLDQIGVKEDGEYGVSFEL